MKIKTRMSIAYTLLTLSNRGDSDFRNFWARRHQGFRYDMTKGSGDEKKLTGAWLGIKPLATRVKVKTRRVALDPRIEG